MKPHSPRLLKAARDADWQQVVGNGGPPCFHLADSRFCLRSERWDGHKTIGGSGPIHEYVSLESLLRSVAPNNEVSERRAADLASTKSESRRSLD